MQDDLGGVTGGNWVDIASHRNWLLSQAENLFSFFEKDSRNPDGGFFELDDGGRPLVIANSGLPTHDIHNTARMVHCYCIAQLMGRPGADAMIDHGMQFLWSGHRDAAHGGYFTSVGRDGATDRTKQGYGHAFVLLAASSAKAAGHPDADRLLADISEVLRTRFWEETNGAFAEEFTQDWQPLSDYRGQNSNMHWTEALMGAFEATGDTTYLNMAERVADLIIANHAANCAWRIPEHFTGEWKIDRDYSGNPMFRPLGTTPGHWLEWARLLVQLWELGERKHEWMTKAASALFLNAVTEGWDPIRGGFYYTLDWNGAPAIAERYWWPCCEGIGAAAFLGSKADDPIYEKWYRRIWNFSASHFIDKKRGGWFPQVDDEGKQSVNPFYGKPDIYHSVQACVIPLLPATASVVGGLSTGSVLLP